MPAGVSLDEPSKATIIPSYPLTHPLPSLSLSLSLSLSHPLLSSPFNQTSQLPLHPNSISAVLQTISRAVLPSSSSSSSSMSFSPSNMSCIPYCSYNQSFHYYAELLAAISCSAPFSFLMPVSVATPSDILLKVNVGFRSLNPARTDPGGHAFCGRSLAAISSSNPAGCMDFFLL